MKSESETMKVWDVLVNFNQPHEGYVTIYAPTKEEAVAKVHKLYSKRHNLEVIQVTESKQETFVNRLGKSHNGKG